MLFALLLRSCYFLHLAPVCIEVRCAHKYRKMVRGDMGRRQSVGNATNSLVRDMQMSIDQLHEYWDEIDMDADQRESRVQTVFVHVRGLLQDMVQSEEQMKDSVHHGIEEGQERIADYRRQLGLPPFSTASFVPRSIKLWRAIEAEQRSLNDQYNERKEDQLRLIHRAETLGYRLGLELDDEFNCKETLLTPLVYDRLSRLCLQLDEKLRKLIDEVENMQEDVRQWKRLLGEEQTANRTLNEMMMMEVACDEDICLNDEVMEEMRCEYAVMQKRYTDWVDEKRFEWDELKTTYDDLCDKCHVSELERNVGTVFDVNEVTLQMDTMRAEVTRMQLFFNDREKVYRALSEFKRLWEEKLAFEEKDRDPNKYKNRAGDLMKTLQSQKKLEIVLIPAAVRAISHAYDEYKSQHPDDAIVIDGMTPVNYVEYMIEDHTRRMEEERKMKKERREKHNETSRTPMKKLNHAAASTSRLPNMRTPLREQTLSPFFSSTSSLQSFISPTKKPMNGPKTSSPKSSGCVNGRVGKPYKITAAGPMSPVGMYRSRLPPSTPSGTSIIRTPASLPRK